MNVAAKPTAYGELIEPATLKIERILPGPVERIWNYLTQSDLRRQWLASGDMEMETGEPFELVWHNDELTDPPGVQPAGHSADPRLTSRIIQADPPHKLVFTWWGQGEVSFELTPQGKDVLLTVIHRRISDRANTLMVGAGWHMHLDILVARVTGAKTEPFWDGWHRLRGEYDKRLPA